MPPTSTVLTGLALATGIAREATDGVPVVKQILGVASRVVALGEQIEKNREDLHALADRAKNLEATIEAIVADRELNDDLLRRLDGLNSVLCAIETLFTRHLKSGRVRKIIGYLFTLRSVVDRMQGDLEDRLRELEVAATLDTNLVARENSRFIGEFRNVHHSEIHLIRRISNLHSDHNDYNYHLATCEGSNAVFVVRNVLLCAPDEDTRRRACVREGILETMSLIQNRHPAIAYLYGRNAGPRHNRFLVLNAGYVRTLGELQGSLDRSLAGRIAVKLVVRRQPSQRHILRVSTEGKDASRHLEKYGAAWIRRSSVFDLHLDERWEPKIGILDDLFPMSDRPELQALEVAHDASGVRMGCGMRRRAQCEDLLIPAQILDLSSRRNHRDLAQFSLSDLRSRSWADRLFGNLGEAGYLRYSIENTVRWADISSLVPLSHECLTNLRRSDAFDTRITPYWSHVLLRRAWRPMEREGSILRAVYIARQLGSGEQDNALEFCIDDDDEMVYHMEMRYDIPASATESVRRHLAITVDDCVDSEGSVVFQLERVTYAGATAEECSGWVPDFPLHWWPCKGNAQLASQCG